MEFLRPGVKGRKYEVWMDRLMPGGADWNPEIEAKIRACDIFVLLVSTRSTGSDYIVDNEIPIIRESQRKNDGVYFYPLLLDWTPKAGLEQVNDKNLRPRDAKPFSSLPPGERSRAMTEVANEIAEIAKTIEERKAAAEEKQLISSILPPPRQRDCHCGRHWWLAAVRVTQRLHAETKRTAAWSTSPACPRPATNAGRTRRRACAARRSLERRQDQHPLAHRRRRRGQVGSRQRMADAAAGGRLSGRGQRARLVVLQPGLEGARDGRRRVPRLGARETRRDDRQDQRLRQGRGNRRGADQRRVLLLLDGVEPLQHGPGPQAGQLKDQGLRAMLRRFAAAPPTGPQPDRADQPRRGCRHPALQGRRRRWSTSSACRTKRARSSCATTTSGESTRS